MMEKNGAVLIFEDVAQGLGLTRAAVYGTVWRYVDPDDGLCRVSMEIMAQGLGMSRGAVLDNIHTLVTAGYLQDTTPNADGTTHAYRPTGHHEHIAAIRKHGGLPVRAASPKAKVLRRKKKIPAPVRWAVWERDNFTCRLCGARCFLAVDHIIPEVKGGTLDMSNLQTLCKTCNSKKGAR